MQNEKVQEKDKEILVLEDHYVPTQDEEYMSEKQLEFFRLRLLKWKTELQNESVMTVEHLKDEMLDEPDISDRATIETDISLELRNTDRVRKLMNQIDSALQRIENGSYGYCEETGEEIGVKRLIARPIARMCIAAQEAHEKFERHHNKIIKLDKLSEEEA